MCAVLEGVWFGVTWLRVALVGDERMALWIAEDEVVLRNGVRQKEGRDENGLQVDVAHVEPRLLVVLLEDLSETGVVDGGEVVQQDELAVKGGETLAEVDELLARCGGRLQQLVHLVGELLVLNYVILLLVQEEFVDLVHLGAEAAEELGVLQLGGFDDDVIVVSSVVRGERGGGQQRVCGRRLRGGVVAPGLRGVVFGGRGGRGGDGGGENLLEILVAHEHGTPLLVRLVGDGAYPLAKLHGAARRNGEGGGWLRTQKQRRLGGREKSASASRRGGNWG
ncbi:hypothetical protein FGB62_165g024 [Gracilaria domingensis]|nr:hypothetical protein FGB62_165g024 [Gracilaria domingensis]